MKKYIRTEKGIYETSQTISVNFKECYIEAYDTQLERWVKKDIIKQADTIEELCDGFYLDDLLLDRFNASGTYDSGLFMFNKAKDLFYGYNKARIPVEMYGFIKTDKGLIYVAKMDNEGKLMLI